MKRRPLATACLLVCLLLGLPVLFFKEPDEACQMEEREIRLTGKIMQKETKKQDYGETMTVCLSDLSNDGLGGRLLCYLAEGQREPKLGSYVEIEGRLKRFERASNPGQFDAALYYQISGISYRLDQAKITKTTTEYNRMGEMLWQIRKHLSGILSLRLPEKEAALMQTILLGEKGSLDSEIKELYQRSGIAHILAISGLHVSVLGMGLYRLLRKIGVPVKGAALLSMLLLFFYGAMTGFSVSAMRAILMFGLRMLGEMLQRTYDMLTAIAAAAVMLLAGQPLFLKSASFVFSFGCVLGLCVVHPALTMPAAVPHQQTKGKTKWQGIRQRLLVPPAMMAVTLPMYLWFYYQIPPYSMLLNLLVIPLMSYLMAAGLLLLLVNPLPLPIWRIAAALIVGVFRIYERACRMCEGLPGAVLNLGKPAVWQLLVYLACLLAVILIRHRQSLWKRWLMMAGAVLILLVRPADRLEITFLDVGQGDCIYVELPGKEKFLVDGGSSSVGSVGKYRILPFLKAKGVRYLEAVFVTHPDEDHCNGIQELLSQGKQQGIRVGCLILPDIGEGSKGQGYRELEKAASEAGISLQYISRGQYIQEKDTLLECLHPVSGFESTDANAYSIVLRFTSGSFTALLTGDLEGSGEQALLEELSARREISENQEADSMAVGPADNMAGSMTDNMAGGSADNMTGSLADNMKDSLTGNMAGSLTDNMAGGPAGITLLKVAHHGSKNSTSEEFLQMINPAIAVISCGKNNRYGHPHEETLERLSEADISWFCTKDYGAITVSVDAKGRVAVKGYRKP